MGGGGGGDNLDAASAHHGFITPRSSGSPRSLPGAIDHEDVLESPASDSSLSRLIRDLADTPVPHKTSTPQKRRQQQLRCVQDGGGEFSRTPDTRGACLPLTTPPSVLTTPPSLLNTTPPTPTPHLADMQYSNQYVRGLIRLGYIF